MDWIQQNLDAYRIVAEILNTLRDTIRRALEVEHGDEWHKIGLPKAVLDRLVHRKEKEKAIDWHESEYQEVTSFAGFADILETLQANPDLLPEFMKLASNPALLYARFVELEVIAQKLALARVIGESELSFLGTFHIRFRKAVDELKSRGLRKRKPDSKSMDKPAEAAAPETPAEEVEFSNQVRDTHNKPAPDQPPADQQPAVEPKPEPKPEPAKAEPAKAEPPRPPQRAASTPQRPPMRSATTPNQPARSPVKAKAAKEAPAESSETSSANIETALGEGDSQAILKELYREVTNLAEGVWTNDVIPVPHIWNKVSGSTWYEINFTKLALKPLSDFYEIIIKVDERLQEGLAKEELQDMLKESHFAQILLSLRDMFQKNNI